jgi:molybdopterin-guanine dinucleotide biosynthesis protein B
MTARATFAARADGADGAPRGDGADGASGVDGAADGPLGERAAVPERPRGTAGAPRVIGLAGWSGAGKTTIVSRLIPLLAGRGVSVSTIKHAHHAFDLDTPGKDSWEHRHAGARQVLVGSALRWALLTELRGSPEPRLAEMLARLDPVDLILVEGFKREPIPKIEIYRAANGKPWRFPEDPLVRGIAADIAPPSTLPHVALDDIEGIAGLVLRHAVPLAALQPGFG